MNAIGKISAVAADKIKLPAAIAGSAVGLATTAAKRGVAVAASLTGRDAEQHDAEFPTAVPPTDVEPDPVEPDPQVESAPASEVAIDPEEPVNVTEELGLDPAPVAKPKPRKKPAPTPVTAIDAEAEASAVDATPADVADRAAASSSHEPRGE